MEGFFSSGETARELGVTQARIRELCEAGAIEATRTVGGQWRVSVDEVERLRSDGLPALPRPLPQGSDIPPGSAPYGSRNHKLLGEPSAELIDSAEAVVRLKHQVEAIGLQRKLAEASDWFKEREVKQIEEQLARQRAATERLIEQAAKLWRLKRIKAWELYAIRLLPLGVDPQVKLRVHEAVRARLANLHPLPARNVGKGIVKAIVADVLRPWMRRKGIQEAIDCAIGSLPWDLRNGSDWVGLRQQAIQAATEAVKKMPPATDRGRREAAAMAAVRPIVLQYEHVKRCLALLDDLPRRLPGTTQEERESIAKAIGSSLVQMPVGTDVHAMESKRDKLLQPFQERFAKRQQDRETARRRAEEARENARKLSAAEFRADLHLSRVRDYLGELDRQRKVQFDSVSERWDIGEKLTKRIRPVLVQELLKTPDMPEQRIRRCIEGLVDENLDEFLS